MTADYSPVYSPRFELSVGGRSYKETGGLVQDLSVDTTIDGAATCSFTLTHPFYPEQEDFADLEWSDVEPGTELEAAMGWGGSGSIEPLFVGKSESLSVDFSPDQGAAVSVSGYGKLHEMMQGDVERSWSDSTVVDVATEVLNEYFSTVEVKGSRSQRNRIIQHKQNDYRFLRQLTSEHGFEFYAERDTAHFEPRTSIGGEPDVTLTYGDELDSFSAEITTADQIGTVEVRYWDMNSEKEIVGSASKEEGDGKEVFRIACDSKEEADDVAESKLSKLSKARVQGNGEAEGIPDLTAGKTVKIEGMGQKFSTTYHVSKASHRMGSSGYQTSFDATEIPE